MKEVSRKDAIVVIFQLRSVRRKDAGKDSFPAAGRQATRLCVYFALA